MFYWIKDQSGYNSALVRTEEYNKQRNSKVFLKSVFGDYLQIMEIIAPDGDYFIIDKLTPINYSMWQDEL